ncbi:hypothetical protein D3C72_2595030 [compost metagenome]
MCSHVVEFTGAIAGAGDDPAVENHHGADRHFAAFGSLAGLFKGRIHEACRLSHRSNNNFS